MNKSGSVKPKSVVYNLQPFGLQCLENFLDKKMDKQRRTSQGTQTYESAFMISTQQERIRSLSGSPEL